MECDVAADVMMMRKISLVKQEIAFIHTGESAHNESVRKTELISVSNTCTSQKKKGKELKAGSKK